MTVKRVLWIAAILLLVVAASPAQQTLGELRLSVTGPDGRPLVATVELHGSSFYNATVETRANGRAEFSRLPLGLYKISVSAKGFAVSTETIQLRSAVPVQKSIRLALPQVATSVDVRAPEMLVDPRSVGVESRVTDAEMSTQAVAAPGRTLVESVASQPGWIQEANGVLHPRGSEYQVQYIVDGVPFTDNRSPAFAPDIDGDDVSSVTVRTGSYPAEIGRKLGGVIEVENKRDLREGVHGQVQFSRGSFATNDTYANLQYGWRGGAVSLIGGHSSTDRYLDAPVLENFTNQGAASNIGLRAEQEFSSRDRATISLRNEVRGFDVPNELIQQAAGQRQRNARRELAVIGSYQHVISENALFDVRGMARKVSADLASNAASTPVDASSRRDLTEQYASASLSLHRAAQDWKFGAEGTLGSVNERFGYLITDASGFEPGTPATFNFRGHGYDREYGAYVQDAVAAGNWTLSLGARLDHYSLLVSQTAVSPRIGVGRYLPSLGLMLHASYDRVFQTPAYENLLLASSSQVAALSPEVLKLPVRPSTGNFFELGAAKSVADKVRIDANYFVRSIRNFADDDTLLSTGVSFPIAFRSARIYGVEGKIAIPRWGRLSGWASYSYLLGRATLPVTGGLFLGGDSVALLNGRGEFPISQDQRNTFSTRFRYELSKRLWIGSGASFGSGLPVEFDGTPEEAAATYGSAIASRVDFDRARVKPSYSIDASAGIALLTSERRQLTLQVDGRNLTNHLNLINFAGLFSGTAIAEPRSAAARLLFQF